MNDNNKNLASQIADKSGKMSPLAIQGKLDQWKKVHFMKLAALAKTPNEAEKLYTICMNTISRNAKLLECTFDSIANCVLTCFQLNLYPGPMQECAFVPFKGVATFIPMYQGLTKLAYNGGVIKSISTNVVWEGEQFKYEEGLRPILHHVPDLDLDHNKAQRVAVYCVIKTRYNDVQIVVLSPRFLAATKSRSKASIMSDSPWNSKYPDDVDWMWKKTALKQAFKTIPKSAEMVLAIEQDNRNEGFLAEKSTIVDIASGPMSPTESDNPENDDFDPETGEVKTKEQAKAIGHTVRSSIDIPVSGPVKQEILTNAEKGRTDPNI